MAPSSAAYAAGTGNADNVAYPHFIDNTQLANYQSLGRLSINISDFDDAATVSALVPGCANYYDVVVVSVPRNVNEAYVNYSPGGALFDLVQGLYLVKIMVTGSSTPIWQEQIAIQPDTLTSRSVSLPGVNSTLFSPISVNIVNSIGASLCLHCVLRCSAPSSS